MNFITPLLRTMVPIWWGSLVTTLLALIPGLEPVRDLLLGQGPVVTGAAVSIALGGWYALTHWLEQYLPDWATRILMGAATPPTYESDIPEGSLGD